VGELYEALRAELLDAPLPADLGEEEARLYRTELEEEVRVLVSKAITAYEETLSAARRAAVEGDFVTQAGEALERMRRLLAEDGRPGAQAPSPHAQPAITPTLELYHPL
jgi:hypothetical protein